MNILIFDESESTAYVLKAILTSQKHRVSISTNLEEAKAKLNTALFDTIFLTSNKSSYQLIKYVEDDLPFVPVILIEDEYSAIKRPSVIEKLERPLKTIDIDKSLKSAKSYLLHFKDSTKKPLQISIDISKGESILKCRSLNMTTRSLLIEGSDTPQFYSFFTANVNEILQTNVRYSETETLNLSSKVAFFDFYPSNIIKDIGLEFAQPSQEQKEVISKILTSQIKEF